MHSVICRALTSLIASTLILGCGSSGSVETTGTSQIPGTLVEVNTSSAPANKGLTAPLNLAKLTTVGGNPNAKLNPEHGRPGHQCGIAVGAPLPGGAPTISQQPTPLPLPTTKVKSNQPIASSSSSGELNPAHGKPGHRCDIAIGAPLSSAPAAQSTPPITATVQPQLKKIKPGMNPYHGEPGHRCDIAVGEPLNSPAR